MLGDHSRMDSLPPVQTLEDLAAALRESADIYRENNLQDQRFGVVAALNAIHQFLEFQGFDIFDLEPLFRPIDALVTLDSNGLDPLFTAGRTGGRPRVSNDQHSRTGILAALADFWIEHQGSGQRVDIALGEAARAINGRWSGQLSKAQLKAARIAVSQEARDHPAVQTAHNTSAALKRLAVKVGPTSAFRTIIANLNLARPSPALGNWVTVMESSSPPKSA